MNEPVAPSISVEFEKIYTKLREKEHRIYTDEELLQLPEVSKLHPHHEEWQKRRSSSQRLLRSVNKKRKPLQLLEVGCGNGWLAAKLATIERTEITGLDINTPELDQAQRVFGKMKNVHFVYGDLRQGLFKDRLFDMIIFASSIQYFPSLKEIITIALRHLTPGGKIHILDSPFYDSNEIMAAKKRTKDYFTSVEFAVMDKFYFHHGIDELMYFHPVILYDPSSWTARLGKYKNPFYHFVIKANGNRR